MTKWASMLRFGLGILLGMGCLFWFTRELEWSILIAQLQQVQLIWVFVAICLLLCEFVLRAFRWNIILSPLQKQYQHNISIKDLFIAQVIGATLNTLLPLRAGEIAKPTIIANRSKLPFWAITTTAIMERVYDLLGMVFVLIFMVLFLQPSFHISAENQILIHNLQLYGGIFGLVAFVAMGIFFTLATQNARPIFVKIISISPSPVQRFFLHLFDGFIEGIGNAKDIKGIWRAGILSIILWLNGALAIYFLFFAFQLALPFGAACFVSVAIALTVALPQAPGFLGVFHIAIEKTLLLWGQTVIVAKGFALVFWAVSFLPVTLLGILFFSREKLNISALLKREKSKQPKTP